ncbi:MAG: GNAT family N-acetyltransferase [Thermodesulfobacteriota bacterium]
MKIEYRPPTPEEYRSLREAVGWRPVEQALVERALRRALFSVVVIQDGRVVGTGRVVGDGGLYYYLQDVMVLPSCQGQGIGKEIISHLLTYIQENAPKGAFVGLMAAKGLQAYYEGFGFQARPADAPGMFQVVR